VRFRAPLQPLEEIPSRRDKNNFETNFRLLSDEGSVTTNAYTKIRFDINVTSIAGYMGLPYRSIYSASKGL
jgi:short-subunit dehydrogenase